MLALVLAAVVASSFLVGLADCQQQQPPMRTTDAAVLKEIIGHWAPVGWEPGTDPCGWPGLECGTTKEGILMPAVVSYIVSISLSNVCPNAENLGLSCVIPDSIGKLDLVERLFLAGNGFVGHIPNTLAGMKSLKWLYLNANQLAGPIPPSLGELKHLEKLYLNGNMLSGHIPPELGGATALHHLEIQQNELSGTIPEALGKLRELVQLDANDNELTGSIPDELGGLMSLHRLDLHGNMLSGTIPPHLLDKNMEALMKVDLSHNMLEGPVPYGVCRMLRLVMLKVAEGNELEGEGVVECEAPHGLHSDVDNRKHCREQLRSFCVTPPPLGLHDEL